MGIENFLHRNSVFMECCANSKKQLLEMIAEKANDALELNQKAVLNVLMERERLGSTGLGNGIAIPHGKLAEIHNVTGLFIKLENPVQFDAVDDQPVDLVFALFAPDMAGSDHLKALSRLARTLRDEQIKTLVRNADDRDALYDALITQPQSQAA